MPEKDRDTNLKNLKINPAKIKIETSDPPLKTKDSEFSESESSKSSSSSSVPTSKSSASSSSQSAPRTTTENHNNNDTSRKAMATEFLTQTAINDEPSPIDTIGFAPYVRALARMLTHPRTKTPLSVGIYGPWGSGKTSFMNQVEKEIFLLVKGKTLIKHVKFNAWKYEVQEKLWAALLQSIIVEIDRSLEWKKKWSIKIRTIWNKINKFALFWNTVIFLILLTIVFSINKPFSLSLSQILFLIPLGLFFGFNFKSLSQVFEKLKMPLGINLAEMFSSDQLSKNIESFREFESELKEILDLYIGSKGRLVIYIDDLDRCSPNKAVDVLETINVFLDTKRCIFLLGMDYEKVTHAIEVKFKDHSELIKNHNIQPSNKPQFGEDFLEKIIQLPIFIPRINNEEMDSFIDGVLATTSSKDLAITEVRAETELEVKDIEFSHETTNFLKLAVKHIEPNPRNIKKFLNMFRFIHLLYSVNRSQFKDVEENSIPLWFLLNYKFKEDIDIVKKAHIDCGWNNLIEHLDVSKHDDWKLIKSLAQENEFLRNIFYKSGSLQSYFSLVQCMHNSSLETNGEKTNKNKEK